MNESDSSEECDEHAYNNANLSQNRDTKISAKNEHPEETTEKKKFKEQVVNGLNGRCGNVPLLANSCKNEVKFSNFVDLETNKPLSDLSKTSDSDSEENDQESPEVCKPLENMMIQQHSDINFQMIDKFSTSEPVNKRISVHVNSNTQDKDSAGELQMQNKHKLMLALKTDSTEDTDSDGDSAYSYDSDFFPLDAVDPYQECCTNKEASFHKDNPGGNAIGSEESTISLLNEMRENEIRLVGSDSRQSGRSLLDGNYHVSLATDDYRPERNLNRSVRGSTSSLGCHMRRGDSMNSLSSKKSELKWPIQHVHTDFFNDFGDCFDEEEDFTCQKYK